MLIYFPGIIRTRMELIVSFTSIQFEEESKIVLVVSSSLVEVEDSQMLAKDKTPTEVEEEEENKYHFSFA